MANFEAWQRVDFHGAAKLLDMPGPMFTGDRKAYLFGAEVFSDGVPVNLFGTVTGIVTVNETDSASVSGSLSGNKAYAVIPGSVFQAPGSVRVALRLTDGDARTVLAAWCGNVQSEG